MARDWVLGRKNPWQELLDVDRKKLHGGTWDYLKENIDYPLLPADRTASSRPRANRRGAVKRGEGKILEARRPEGGLLARRARQADDRFAVCTHMGCLVHWNEPSRPGIAPATARASSPRAKCSPAPPKRRWRKSKRKSPLANERQNSQRPSREQLRRQRPSRVSADCACKRRTKSLRRLQCTGSKFASGYFNGDELPTAYSYWNVPM